MLHFRINTMFLLECSISQVDFQYITFDETAKFCYFLCILNKIKQLLSGLI